MSDFMEQRRRRVIDKAAKAVCAVFLNRGGLPCQMLKDNETHNSRTKPCWRCRECAQAALDTLDQ